MDTQIVVALIGAAAAVVAAIIGIWSKKEKNTIIKQKAFGKNNSQVGIQINKKESDKDAGNS